jgi:hypothetical protein
MSNTYNESIKDSQIKENEEYTPYKRYETYEEDYSNPYENDHNIYDFPQVSNFATKPTTFPKPVKITFDDENQDKQKLVEFNEKIQQAQIELAIITEEYKKISKEYTGNQDILKAAEDTFLIQKEKYTFLERKFHDMHPETVEECQLRTINEINALQNAREKYKTVKAEFDSLVSSSFIEKPIKNIRESQKDFELRRDVYSKKLAESESNRIKKDRLSNTLRNREIDISTAEKELEKAKLQPSIKQQLEIDLRTLSKDIENSVRELSKLRMQVKEYEFARDKVDAKNKDIQKLLFDKNAFQMRGCSVLTKGKTIHYDNNGKIVKPHNDNKIKCKQELDALDANPPMVEERAYNYIVKSEYDFLVDYLQGRISLYNAYGVKGAPGYNPDDKLDSDDITKEWTISTKEEIKETKAKIAELKKKLYTDSVWSEIDTTTYNKMKQEILDKYNLKMIDFKNNDSSNQSTTKEYTMDDFVKSLKKH